MNASEIRAEKKIQSQQEGYGYLTETDLSDVTDAQIKLMQQGVDEMLTVLTEAAETGYHVLTNVLASRGEEPFVQWEHYPPGDVQDKETGAIWFYHAHGENEIARPWFENGHFHLFRYTEMLRKGAEPLALPKDPDFEKGGLCHLVAVSFDPNGLPVRIFTTNRWVAGEWLYPAEDVIPLLDGFEITSKDAVNGSEFTLSSRWLSALLKLYRPQIEWALRERDKKITALKAVDENYSENKQIEVLSAVEFDLAGQIDAIEAEATKRGLGA
ncbi:MAG: hypothetical protein WBD01_05105 [Salaquimonas sp.]